MKSTSQEYNQSLKLSTFQNLRQDRHSTTTNQPINFDSHHDVYRMIAIQAVTIEEFLNEQN